MVCLAVHLQCCTCCCCELELAALTLLVGLTYFVAPQNKLVVCYKFTLLKIKWCFFSVHLHFFAIKPNKVTLASHDPGLQGSFFWPQVFSFVGISFGGGVKSISSSPSLADSTCSCTSFSTRLGFRYFPPSFLLISVSKSMFKFDVQSWTEETCSSQHQV